MKSFGEVRSQINFYTAVDDQRLRFIYDQVVATRSLGTPMAEVGVYNGGSAKLIGLTDPERVLFAVDTFSGLPEPTGLDEGCGHSAGDFNDVSIEAVRKNLEGAANVVLVQAMFPGEGPDLLFGRKKFSFVHIDVDLGQSTIDCLVYFWPRMVEGGIIVVDDYGWKDTPGVKKAVDAFFEHSVAKVEDSGFNSCRMVKP